MNREARAYHRQALIRNEIVKDTISYLSQVMTFFPLYNTGIANKRAFDGKVLDFGTT